MVLYKLFFGQKYCDYINNPITIKETCFKLIKFTNKWINNTLNKDLLIIDKVIKKLR